MIKFIQKYIIENEEEAKKLDDVAADGLSEFAVQLIKTSPLLMFVDDLVLCKLLRGALYMGYYFGKHGLDADVSEVSDDEYDAICEGASRECQCPACVEVRRARAAKGN